MNLKMKQILRKTLLALLGGVMSTAAWADGDVTTIGATDYTDDGWVHYSAPYTIGADQTLHLEFVNHHATNEQCVDNEWGKSGSEPAQFRNWFNYVLILSSDNTHTSQYFYVRPDNYGGGTKYSDAGNEGNWDWGTFADETNGAKVTMDIMRHGSTVTIIANLKSASGVYRYQKYSMDIDESVANIYANLTAEHAYVEIDNSATKTFATETAGSYVYTNDFSSNSGLTFVGSSSLTTDGTFGYAFQNTASATPRTNYLRLPNDLLAHSMLSKQLTIGFWVKAKGDKAGASSSYNWAPIFTAYADAPSTENTVPMLACQYRGLLQVNCVAGFSDYTDGQNDDPVNHVYNDFTGNTDWLSDHEWHYYTVVFNDEIASVYFDGVLKNQWTANKTYNNGSTDVTWATQKGLFYNGSVLKYICLGGNQAWNWGDNDPGFTFARFRVQNSAMTASDIATRMTADKATFTVKIGETEWATLTSDKILNFDGISGLTANVVSDYNTSTKSITVTPVTEVPAATPLLLNGNEGVYSVPVLASTSASIGTNYLVRGPGDEVGEATGTNTRFVLVVSGTNAVFKKIGDTKHPEISTDKAYLEIPAVLSARELSINLDGGDATAIKTMKVGTEDNIYYNLQGQRVLYPTKGLYIVNGKKVIVK